jgi:NAD(P)-dependent dehydrogenase (short-subunit alcohol dehydrogenase family)
MPIPLIGRVLDSGLSSIPHAIPILRAAAVLAVLYLLKTYFSGSKNPSPQNLHGKVILVTGGTGGVGAATVRELAGRGAQVVLLTRHGLDDPFLAEYIFDLRKETGNELITSETVDLADLYSVRKFATQWVDSVPVRRLDGVVLLADEWIPSWKRRRGRDGILKEAGGKSKDGVERWLAVNYLAVFHLLSILSPALRAQPPDRDVRVVVGTCASYMGGDISGLLAPPRGSANGQDSKKKAGKSKKAEAKSRMDDALAMHPALLPVSYASTKLATLAFLSAYQKHLSHTPRPDALPSNARVVAVDPGWTRTPGLRRYISGGSLWGLLFYVLTYPLWWMILKPPEMGAQSVLWAIMDSTFKFGPGIMHPDDDESALNKGLGRKPQAQSEARGKAAGPAGPVDEASIDSQLRSSNHGVTLVKECSVTRIARSEVLDEQMQGRLWQGTEAVIEQLERESAVRRALEKKEAEDVVSTESPKKNAEKQLGSRRGKKAAEPMEKS